MKSVFRSILLTALLLSPAAAVPAEAPGGEVRAPNAPKPYTPYVPDGLRDDITVDQKLGESISLDAEFTDEFGNTVRIGDYLNKGRPVVIQLGYYGCPMLCGLISRGMIDVFSAQKLEIGKDYEVVSISIDPTETWRLAQLKKRSYMEEYNRPGEAAGWHFLVGTQANIVKIADAIGFRYRWIDAAQQYSHPAALVIVTPDGKISRYLFGVKFDPQTFRLSVVEASNGKVGSFIDDFLLTCFMYDGSTGKYAFAAMRLMQMAGAVMALGLGLTLFVMFRREARAAVSAATKTESDAGK